MTESFPAGQVLCLGFFDGVHLGHQALLKEGRRISSVLQLPCAALTFDRHPKSILGGPSPLLLNTLLDRDTLLTEIGGMDRVIALPFTPALRDLSWDRFIQELLVDRLGARYLIAGENHRFGAGGKGTSSQLQQLCRLLGIGCSIIPSVLENGTPVSSTLIRTTLFSGDVTRALTLLGHPHRLTGTVLHGKKLGRILGFPTVNLSWPAEVQPLPYGVYGGRAFADGRWYKAMTNVGIKPTVNGTQLGAESFLVDYHGDLYGKTVTLEFSVFLRPEKKFPSIDALKAQIALDLKHI